MFLRKVDTYHPDCDVITHKDNLQVNSHSNENLVYQTDTEQHGLLVFPTKLNTEYDKQLPGIFDEVRVA